MRRSFAICPVVAASLALFSSAFPAHAQTKPSTTTPLESRTEARQLVSTLLKQGKIMRASEVKRGMKGYALSVFQGTKIEKFPVEVLGNLQKVMGGGDLVLIKVTGGPVVTRQSGIIQGMSGSPVYFNGKMLGAIAIGFGFPKEPIGGVTPITQMIETALPDTAPPKPPVKVARAPKPDEVYTASHPIEVAGEAVHKVVVARDPKRMALRDGTLTMQPCTRYVQISGVASSSLPRWEKLMAPYGFTPIIGGGAMSDGQFKQVFGLPSQKRGVVAPMVPGAAIGVQMVSGDIDMTGVGTVTFRQGQRLLAFGHPMFEMGPVSMPMTTAYVHDIFPAYDISFKLASPIQTVGALQQDTAYAIGGTLGRQAETVPMRVGVVDERRHINKKYNVRMIKDPMFTAQLALEVAAQALTTTLGQDSDKMVSVTMRMNLANAPSIVRRNYVYAGDLVLMGGIKDLYEALMLTQMNSYEKGAIQSIDLNVRVEQTRKTARIRRVFADRNRVKAGETVKISVELEPHGSNGETFTRQFSVPVAKDAPDGALRIVASPGASFWTGRSRAGGAPPRVNNLRELVSAYQQIGAADELLVQASTPQSFLLVDRTKVPNPPVTWSRLVPPGPATSVGVFNEVVEQTERLPYSLTGLESIVIPVESLRDTDRRRPDVASGDAQQSTTSQTTQIVSSDSDADISSSDEDATNTWVEVTSWENNFGFTRADRVSLPTLEERAAHLRELMQKSYRAQVGAIVPVASVPAATPTATAKPSATPTPTPTADPTASNIARPVGRWVQQSAADFGRGTLSGTIVTNTGSVAAGSSWDRLVSTGEPVAWSVARDSKGNTYLGTGHRARLVKIAPDGAVTTLYDGPEVAISALAVDAQDNVYAGVSPGGRVLRFNSGTMNRQVILQTDAVFIHALTFDAQGNLLAGVGGARGAVYRVANPATVVPGARFVKPLATVAQEHILSVTSGPDAIYAGTGDDAVLYRIDPAQGIASPLYEVTVTGTTTTAQTYTVQNQGGTPTIIISGGGMGGGNAMYLLTASDGRGAPGVASPRPAGGSGITGVVARPDGVFFTTATSGSVYRWTNGRGVEEVLKTTGRAAYALRGSTSGLLLAVGNGPGNRGQVWEVQPAEVAAETKAARLLESPQLQVTALGNDVAATSNNAAVYVSNAASAPVFISNVFDAGQIVRWGALRYNVEDARAVASIETRSGNVLEPDSTWSAWQPAGSTPGESRVLSPAARYLQYRINFAPEAKGKGVSRLEVLYRAPNHVPNVRWTLPVGGEYISGKKTLTWVGADPDKDPLRYRVAVLRDGAEPKPVELKTVTASTVELDTTKFADGEYRVRIEATDAARNPEEPLSDVEVSEPFLIDNTVPSLQTPVGTKTETGWVLRFSATDQLSPLAGAEWRLLPPGVKPSPVRSGTTGKSTTEPISETKDDSDEKTSTSTATTTTTTTTTSTTAAKPDWQAAAAEDGIFDSRSESIIARMDPDTFLSPGQKLESGARIEIRVRDAAGNYSLGLVTLP